MLPADWRARFTAAVRCAEPGDVGWFEARPLLAPELQLAIYQEQFELRMRDAFAEEIPALSRWAGEAQIDAWIRAFLAARPPRSWTLAEVADGLADWLETQGAPDIAVDLARLDAAVSSSFLASEPAALAVASLRPDLRLRLSPPTHLLRLRTNAHHVRLALLEERPAIDVIARDQPLAIYRGPDLQVRHLELSPGLYGLLGALPATVEAAVEAALGGAALAGEPIDGATLSGWFSLAASRRLVEPA